VSAVVAADTCPVPEAAKTKVNTTEAQAKAHLFIRAR
jgi:hypothetical protein